jgi:hypothetical protein
MKGRLLLPALLLAVSLPALPAAAQDLSFRGWGVRAGVSDNPDQGVVGAQFNFGEVYRDVRLQPSVDLGFGDGQTVLSAALPVFYRFPASRTLTLYGGGGLDLGYVHRDHGGSDFDISPLLAGGVEWPVAPGRLSVELSVAGGNLPAAKLVAAWMF